MGLRDQLENLSPREQRLLGALGVVAAALILIGIPAYLYLDLADARAHNDSVRKVISEMGTMNELLAKRSAERTARESRYQSPAPALAAFIEGAAQANGLEVPEATDRPNVTTKGYVERVTQVKMRKVGLKSLVQMLERIEKSGHPVSVSQLSIKPRGSEPDSYDVTLTISAFDKEGAEKQPGGADSADPKGKAPAPKGKPAPAKKPAGKGREL
jgi:type II secretory pathway component PulM